jgi:hypothetical protein
MALVFHSFSPNSILELQRRQTNVRIRRKHNTRSPFTFPYVHFFQIGQRIFATFFALCYVLPLSVIAIFSLCIVRHLANVEKTSSLGAARRAAAGGGPGSSSNGTGHRGVDKKRHAGRLLVLVVVLFALLWLPVHVYLLVSYFYGEIKHPAFQVAAVAFTCLAYFNSCVNPFIYNHASKEFREAFIEVARCGRVSSTSATSTAKTATCDPNAKTVMASSLTAKTANRTSTLAVDDCKSMTKQNGGGADEVGDSMTRLLSVGNNAVESGEGRSAGVVGAESKNGCGGCADGN